MTTERFGNQLTDESQSAFKKYCAFMVGRQGVMYFLVWEIYHFFLAPLPGAIGVVLRQICLPILLGGVGRKVVVGRNVSFRHPHKIFLGDQVIIDENCVLDAKGDGNQGIEIGNKVLIARNTILSCKGTPPGGYIKIGDNSNIAMNCVIHSEEKVEIGKNVLFAAYCYLVGGGNHKFDQLDVPIIDQPSENKGGIVIEDDSWLGARVTVLDGVKIEKGSIIGAGAVVKDSVDAYTIAAGIPAKPLKSRKG